MVTAHVRFFGVLADRFGDSLTVELSDGATVKTLYERLGLPGSAVSLCIVNGTQLGPGASLPDDAEVMLIPVVAGG